MSTVFGVRVQVQPLRGFALCTRAHAAGSTNVTRDKLDQRRTPEDNDNG